MKYVDTSGFATAFCQFKPERLLTAPRVKYLWGRKSWRNENKVLKIAEPRNRSTRFVY